MVKYEYVLLNAFWFALCSFCIKDIDASVEYEIYRSHGTDVISTEHAYKL